MTGEPFATQLARGLASYGSRPFIEYENVWYSGEQVTRYSGRIAAVLAEAGVPAGAPVGVVVRNRLPHAAAILGFVAAGTPVVMIYGFQSERAIAADIEALHLAAVVADREDWTDTVLTAAVGAGTVAVAVAMAEPRVESLTARGESSCDPALGEAGIHILTSGTTGPPKRIPIRTAVLEHTVRSITHGQVVAPSDPPDVIFLPFGNIGGACQLLAAPCTGKRMVLLEKFTVAGWVGAVKRYRIRRGGAQPTIVRMVLDADVPPEDLASLEVLVGGAGPLEQSIRDEFERRYGVPVLWAYGATEFGGSVCAWTPDLWQRYGRHKPDSAGKPLPGVQVRVVDGYLEARVEVMGPDWIRTTDLASIDADGFITVHGRGDGAINRGGFKILPETVRGVLLTHPGVRDACVVGVPDRRLGEVPFAAVERRSGTACPTESELLALVRDALPSHHVPVAIAVVDDLPRSEAMKVRPAEVAALYRPSSPQPRTPG
jgi:long-chain acyl-CoA synthetase